MPPPKRYPCGKVGYTLLELLIVIVILITISAIIFFVINPAETLRKARDTQRVTDLNMLLRSTSFYLSATSTPFLSSATSNDGCKAGSSYLSGDNIYYSFPTDSGTISDTSVDGGSANVPTPSQVSDAALRKVDGTGWVHINFSSLRANTPISHLPVDPTNTIANLGSLSASDSIYRYACDSSLMMFEFNANLESDAFTNAPDNLESEDGGNNSNLYEVGTKLDILGTGSDF